MSTLHFNTGIGTKIQLCLMMFLQYMLSAVWWVPLAAYLSHTLKLEVYQVSLVL
ncbi:MAG TPA: MFS transporter, partial [Parabacteroides goldsteinii]|nr:MFS transporter [Parabacteroides goldsteinii]